MGRVMNRQYGLLVAVLTVTVTAVVAVLAWRDQGVLVFEAGSRSDSIWLH